MTSTFPQPRRKKQNKPVVLKEIWFNQELNREEHKIKRALRDNPQNTTALQNRLNQVQRLQSLVQIHGNVIAQVLCPKDELFDAVAYITNFYATQPQKQCDKKQPQGLWKRFLEAIR